MKEIHQSFQLSLTSKNLVQLLNNNNFAYLKNILKSIIKCFKIKINKQNFQDLLYAYDFLPKTRFVNI